jgi:nitrous-oxide reductase
MDPKSTFRKMLPAAAFVFALAAMPGLQSCNKTDKSSGGATSSALSSDAASKVYVAPGKHDELYSFLSGGFSGQVAVYGIPSGRLLKVIPVFSQNAENGYGYNENTKAMLNTSFGFVPGMICTTQNFPAPME